MRLRDFWCDSHLRYKLLGFLVWIFVILPAFMGGLVTIFVFLDAIFVKK